MLDESKFNGLVADVFKRMLKALDAADPDALDADSTGDMLTITGNKSGQKVVVNTQRAVAQIWVAGKGVGVHFSRGPDGRWLDDKGKGLELKTWIVGCVRGACGLELGLS